MPIKKFMTALRCLQQLQRAGSCEGAWHRCSLAVFLLSLLTHFKRALRAARATIWGHKINHSYDPSHHSSHDSHTQADTDTVQVSGWRETKAVAVCDMFDYLYATTWPYPISNSCN